MRRSHSKCLKPYYYTHEIRQTNPKRLQAEYQALREEAPIVQVSSSTGGLLTTWLQAGSLSREEIEVGKGRLLPAQRLKQRLQTPASTECLHTRARSVLPCGT